MIDIFGVNSYCLQDAISPLCFVCAKLWLCDISTICVIVSLCDSSKIFT